jgi:hypothetical protein
MQNLITALSNSLIVYFYIFITFFVDIFENWFNNDYMVFNTDKLKFIANDIIDISWYLFAFYICAHLLNIYITKYYANFINLNSNLIQTKSKYFLSIQLFMTFYKMHDTNIAILIFIAFVQYKMLGKLINLKWKGLRRQISLCRSFIHVYPAEDGLHNSLFLIGNEVKQSKSRLKSRADGSKHRGAPHDDVVLQNIPKRSIKGPHQRDDGYGLAGASCTRLR